MSRQAVTAAVVAAAVVLIAALVFYFYPSDTVPPGGAPEVTEIERGDSAREVIADLQDDAEAQPADYDAAYERGQEFLDEGQIADAQLMYFYAARAGHAPAAFQLGTMYDPLHHTPETSLMAEPDPFQAYKWYMQALEGGVDEAAARLEVLREWAEAEAAAANVEAEQLLLQWN